MKKNRFFVLVFPLPSRRFARNNTALVPLNFSFFFPLSPFSSQFLFLFPQIKFSSSHLTPRLPNKDSSQCGELTGRRRRGGGSHDSRRFSRRKTLNRAPIHEEIEIPRRASLFRRGTLLHVPSYSLYFRFSPIYEIVGLSFLFSRPNFYNFTTSKARTKFRIRILSSRNEESTVLDEEFFFFFRTSF